MEQSKQNQKIPARLELATFGSEDQCSTIEPRDHLHDERKSNT